MNLNGRRVLVVGLARTGLAVARFLREKGAVVSATDNNPSPMKGVQTLLDMGIKVETGGHTLGTFLDVELIILSPGVPPDIPPLVEARHRGIRIISEIELAYQFIHTPIIAVAGTNGKTTTATLLGEVLKAGGKKVFLGGNIGMPLIEYARGDQSADYVVSEVSSFQLEGIAHFRPFISILLNVTEDHLDRYGNFNEYVMAKMRLFENQGEGDIAIVNMDDPVINSRSQRFPNCHIIPFSTTHVLGEGLYYKDGNIFYTFDGGKEAYPVRDFKLNGMYNIENIMAVIGTARNCDVRKVSILKTIEGFKGLPHRMEFVRELNGVTYYNDSKGTNIGALRSSLEGQSSPVILIAGGKDKGGDYKTLVGIVKERVRLLILLGEARFKIYEALGDLVETILVGSMEEAVDVAHTKASPGDVVLLSPACSSFDMFRDYQERGERFKELVMNLPSYDQAPRD